MWAALAAGSLAGWGVNRATATPTPPPPMHVDIGNCRLAEVGVRELPNTFTLPRGMDGAHVVAFFNARIATSRSRADGDDWALRGPLDETAVAALKQRLAQPPPLDRLRVTSFGGDERAAIELASLLVEQDLTLEVESVCGSACANYLLPAAPRVVLNGIVLMHGSPLGCQRRLGRFGAVAELGWRGALLLDSAAKRQVAFEQRHAHLKTWVERSASKSRGDPSGAPHGWLRVPLPVLAQAHPALTIGPGAGPAHAAYRTLATLFPVFSDAYAPDASAAASSAE